MSEEKKKKSSGCGSGCLLILIVFVMCIVTVASTGSQKRQTELEEYKTGFAELTNATDQERFEFAAKYVFEDELIEARANSKYPTVVIKKTGKAEHIRLLSNSDALSFIKRVKEIRDAYGFDFETLYFNVHTDLVDVYGNKSDELVLSFGITKETLDRINFENMLYSNIPKIAIDWYEHPAMK